MPETIEAFQNPAACTQKLILSDEDLTRLQIGQVFAHIPPEEDDEKFTWRRCFAVFSKAFVPSLLGG